MKAVLAVDIGTSSVKSGLVTADGGLQELHIERLDSGDRTSISWDPNAWIYVLKSLVLKFEKRAAAAAIVISGNGPTLIPLDKEGNPSFSALHWMNDQNVVLPNVPSFFLPKAAWLREKHPRDFARTRCFLSCPEYVAYYLTGEKTAVTPHEDFTPYVYTKESIQAYCFEQSLFPPFVQTGRMIGRLRSELSRQLDLPAGIPVYAGGPDFLMSLLGTATLEPGMTCDRAGTSEGINYCSQKRQQGERLRVLPHVLPQRYNVASILSSTGRLFSWYKQLTGQEHVSYREMLLNIEDDIYTFSRPWFFPTIHEGAIWEFSHGMFIGLGAEHGPREIGRAVVHSIGFAVREAIEILEQRCCPVGELRLSGGQAKNRIWNQIKADMTGKVLLVPEVEDSELVGNACAGFTGLGEYGSLEEASGRMVRIKERYEPRPEAAKRFEEAFKDYCSRYRAFRKTLSTVTKGSTVL
jgi:xylulokinase